MRLLKYKQVYLALLISICLSSLVFSGATAQRAPDADSLAVVHLYQVIRSGDLPKLEALLKEGTNANTVFNGYSALMVAAVSVTADAMKLLISKGADVNYRNKDSITALWLAVPDEEKTKLLLKHGAKADVRSAEGNSVLVKLAGIPGSAAIMQLLISKGCDFRKSGPFNNMMYYAASSDDTAILGLLIRSGVSVNDTTSFGDYPINFATNYRSFNL